MGEGNVSASGATGQANGRRSSGRWLAAGPQTPNPPFGSNSVSCRSLAAAAPPSSAAAAPQPAAPPCAHTWLQQGRQGVGVEGWAGGRQSGTSKCVIVQRCAPEASAPSVTAVRLASRSVYVSCSVSPPLCAAPEVLHTQTRGVDQPARCRLMPAGRHRLAFKGWLAFKRRGAAAAYHAQLCSSFALSGTNSMLGPAL